MSTEITANVIISLLLYIDKICEELIDLLVYPWISIYFELSFIAYRRSKDNKRSDTRN